MYHSQPTTIAGAMPVNGRLFGWRRGGVQTQAGFVLFDRCSLRAGFRSSRPRERVWQSRLVSIRAPSTTLRASLRALFDRGFLWA
jgi:hypothetical protein